MKWNGGDMEGARGGGGGGGVEHHSARTVALAERGQGV